MKGNRRSVLARAIAATLVALVLATLGPSRPVAAVNVAGGYSQNFDSLANTGTSSTLPAGWTFNENSSCNGSGYTADNGSSSTGDTFSYGSTNSTDRALGELSDGGCISNFILQLDNNSGVTIGQLTIAYTGEQWRKGLDGADRLDFQYCVSGCNSSGGGTWTNFDALDFNAPTTTGSNNVALDGNLSANQTAKSSTITGLSIAAGATFFIRWVADNASQSQDDGLSVDNLSVSPLAPNAVGLIGFEAASGWSGSQLAAASVMPVSISSSIQFVLGFLASALALSVVRLMRGRHSG